jgi:hypothetical protein
MSFSPGPLDCLIGQKITPWVFEPIGFGEIQSAAAMIDGSVVLIVIPRTGNPMDCIASRIVFVRHPNGSWTTSNGYFSDNGFADNGDSVNVYQSLEQTLKDAKIHPLLQLLIERHKTGHPQQ